MEAEYKEIDRLNKYLDNKIRYANIKTSKLGEITAKCPNLDNKDKLIIWLKMKAKSKSTPEIIDCVDKRIAIKAKLMQIKIDSTDAKLVLEIEEIMRMMDNTRRKDV